MAARSKATAIVPEVRCILAKYGVTIASGSNAGEGGCIPPDGNGISTTWEQAVLRLLAIQTEILLNIRENETSA